MLSVLLGLLNVAERLLPESLDLPRIRSGHGRHHRVAGDARSPLGALPVALRLRRGRSVLALPRAAHGDALRFNLSEADALELSEAPLELAVLLTRRLPRHLEPLGLLTTPQLVLLPLLHRGSRRLRRPQQRALLPRGGSSATEGRRRQLALWRDRKLRIAGGRSAQRRGAPRRPPSGLRRRPAKHERRRHLGACLRLLRRRHGTELCRASDALVALAALVARGASARERTARGTVADRGLLGRGEVRRCRREMPRRFFAERAVAIPLRLEAYAHLRAPAPGDGHLVLIVQLAR